MPKPFLKPAVSDRDKLLRELALTALRTVTPGVDPEQDRVAALQVRQMENAFSRRLHDYGNTQARLRLLGRHATPLRVADV